MPQISPGTVRDTYDDRRAGHAHEALSHIAAPRGAPVVAVDAGVVTKLFQSVPGGLTIYLFDESRRYAYYYAHLDAYAAELAEGQRVARGQVIGYVGSTGNAAPDAPHLHFAIFKLEPEARWWHGTPCSRSSSTPTRSRGASIPGTRHRLPFDQRWPGVIEDALPLRIGPVRVIEDCVNGRRTVCEDPFKRGGTVSPASSSASRRSPPLVLVILMLGTNDFQSMHPHVAWHSAQGIAALVRAIRAAPIEPGMPVPPVLVVAPPPFDDPRGPLGPKFAGAAEKSVGLAAAFAEVAAELGCAFFDAGRVTPASRVDGIHLDADQHGVLGRALAEVVRPLLASGPPSR